MQSLFLGKPVNIQSIGNMVIRYCYEKVADIHNRSNNPISVLDDISNNLCSYLDLTRYLSISMPSYSSLHNSLEPLLHELNNNLSLYSILKQYLQTMSSRLGEEENMVGQKFLDDFILNGINVKDKALFRKYQSTIRYLENNCTRGKSSLISLANYRLRLANLLNYENYFHMANYNSHLKTRKDVLLLLDRVSKRSRMHAESTKETMPLKDFLDSMNKFMKMCFQIRFETNRVEDIFILDFYSDDAFLGKVILNIFSRSGIPSHHVIRARKINAENIVYNQKFVVQTPIVAINCSFRNSSLSRQDAISLVHELGHAFHAGTRCALDIAEIPSTLFEAILLETKLIDSPFFGSIDDNLEHQISLAKFDLKLHCIKKTIANLPKLPEKGASFSHITSYGGSYYSYLYGNNFVRRVLSKLNADPGLLVKIQNELLALGGCADLAQVHESLSLSIK